MDAFRVRLAFRDLGLIAAIFVGTLLRPTGPLPPRASFPAPGAERLGLEDPANLSDVGMLGLLPGGFRRLAAGYCWIQTYAAWETGDALAVIAGLDRTVALDPGALHCWINGARMLAHDLPRWKLSTLGGEESLPRAVCAQVQEEHLQAALRFLAKAESHHPMTAMLAIESGILSWHGRRDVAAAVDAFERATRCDDAPFYAFRIHAELLRLQGRPRDAHRSLCRFLSGLRLRENTPLIGSQTGPRDLPPASLHGRGDPQPDVVLKRIRQLEQELGIDPIEAFKLSEE